MSAYHFLSMRGVHSYIVSPDDVMEALCLKFGEDPDKVRTIVHVGIGCGPTASTVEHHYVPLDVERITEGDVIGDNPRYPKASPVASTIYQMWIQLRAKPGEHTKRRCRLATRFANKDGFHNQPDEGLIFINDGS